MRHACLAVSCHCINIHIKSTHWGIRVTLPCRLVPAYVQEEAWNSLAGKLEMGMKLKVRVHKVWLTFLFRALTAEA